MSESLLIGAPVPSVIESAETAIAGTPHYMAPEQADGLKLDARCDQYALGITLFQLLCGRLPYPGERMDQLPQPLHELQGLSGGPEPGSRGGHPRLV